MDVPGASALPTVSVPVAETAGLMTDAAVSAPVSTGPCNVDVPGACALPTVSVPVDVIAVAVSAVTVALFSVDRPVTSSVPPTVALLVTAALESVDAPTTVSAPLHCIVPAVVVAPASVVNTPAALEIVPTLVKWEPPKLIDPLLSVMEPLPSVSVPTWDPVAAVTAVLNVFVPVNVLFPASVTLPPSFAMISVSMSIAPVLLRVISPCLPLTVKPPSRATCVATLFTGSLKEMILP